MPSTTAARLLDDRPLMARVLPLVYLAGSGTFLIVLLAGGTPSGTRGAYLAIDAVGWAVTAMLFSVRRTMPRWAFSVSQWTGIAIVTALVLFGRDPTTPFALFYLWLVVQAAYFGTTRRAIAEGAGAATGYAAGLAGIGALDDQPARWVMLVTTIAVVAALTRVMRVRIDRLVDILHEAAKTDALTGLANRRSLVADLAAEVRAATPAAPLTVALFDLDGFKAYNDTFGHPAGDALLVRLATKLAAVVDGLGVPYRLGGDEFCLLIRGDATQRGWLVQAAREALAEQGEGFSVTTSCGVAVVPAEATSAEAAMSLADRRLYREKFAVGERRVQIDEQIREATSHSGWTCAVARELGVRMGFSTEDLDVLTRAAQLHDIGKVALPETLLHKGGALTVAELDFLRRHVIIGERLIESRAPLGPVARVVRATLERWDGSGYPDGLRGEEIPLAARIIAACEAFQREPTRDAEVLQALRGTQLAPAVVDALRALLSEQPALADAARPLPI